MKQGFAMIICILGFFSIIMMNLTGCQFQNRAEIAAQKPIPAKYCVSACVKTEFKNFHHGSSQTLGGAASSSMNGLAQKDIYDSVYTRCEQFYKDTPCCEGNIAQMHLIKHVHGYDYGPCEKND